MAKKKQKNKKKATSEATKIARIPTWMTNSPLHYFIIAILAFGLYANTLYHDFCQDDAIVITDNMFTKKGTKGISGIWNNDTFYGFFKQKKDLVSGGRYRPLTLVLFALEWELFSSETKEGSTASPFGFHVVNVLLFVLLGFMLYKVTITLLAYYKNQEAKLMAFVSTLIFVAHPVHTEVVANIKGADEIVALLGSLATLYFILKAYRSGKTWMLIIGSLIFGLTIFSKENTITFIAIIPVALFLFGHKKVGIQKGKLGRFGGYTFALILSIIPFLIKRGKVLFDNPFQLMGSGEPVMELMNNPFLKYINNLPTPYTAGERIATIIYTLGDYLRLLFMPIKLTSDYYPHHVTMMSFTDWQVIMSIVLYIGLIFLAVKSLRKNPMISLGIFIYLASLSIVSNFVFPVGTFMAERFIFMPSVGFSLALGAGFNSLFRKGNKTAALAILGILILLFSIKTIQRNPAWKNDTTLFLTDVKNSPNSAKIRNAAGGTKLSLAAKSSDISVKKQRASEALVHLKVAIEAHPRYASAWLLQGNAYNVLEQYDQAIMAYKNALKLKNNYPDAIKNLGITYQIAGNYYGKEKGDIPKAISLLLEAVKINPKSIESNRLLGIAYAMSNNPAKGIPYLEKAFSEGMKSTASTTITANIALDLSLAYSKIDQEKMLFYNKKAWELNPLEYEKRTGRKGNQTFLQK